jgi:hypothetical protein
MPEEARPIRCVWGRVTSAPCMEPATVEILGPQPTLYCAEHARHRLEEIPCEQWEDELWGGLEDYVRDCEEAASQLRRWEHEAGGVLYEVLVAARTYLECYQLRRARAKLIESGGKPRAVESERAMLEFFDKSAAEFGWTDEPPWVPKVREWIRAEEESRHRCA